MSDKIKELRALTGLRGIAAVSVALSHYEIGDLANILKVLYWKNAAVDLFFCLSGFTLCVAYKAVSNRRLPVWNYATARIARIYPLFLVALGVLILSNGGKSFVNECARDLAVRDFIQQVLLINAWPFFGTGTEWNFPAWSVSVEFFCYLFIFPPLFYASYVLPRLGWVARALYATVLMAVSAFVFVRYFDTRTIILERWPGTAFPAFSYYILLLRGILGMTAGWLIYGSFVARDRFWRFATQRTNIIVLSTLGVLVCASLGMVPVQWMLVIFPALVLGLTDESSLSARLISSKPVHYLGIISYSIYLLHIPWYAFLAHVLGVIDRDASHHPASFILLATSLVPVSALSYHFVEMPLRLLIRRAFESPSDGGIAAVRWVLPVMIVGLVLVQAQWAGLMRAVPSAPVALGQEIARPPTFDHAACAGWSGNEDWGVWSIGHRSLIAFPLAEAPTVNTKLALKGMFFLSDKHPDVMVRVSANGVLLETMKGSLKNSQIDQLLDLPPAVFISHPRSLELVIAVENPTSPLALGLSNDIRNLGFGLTSLMVVDNKESP